MDVHRVGMFFMWTRGFEVDGVVYFWEMLKWIFQGEGLGGWVYRHGTIGVWVDNSAYVCRGLGSTIKL